MEVKLKILEISPNIEIIKTNKKDIISMSFRSADNYSKIEDIEQFMIKNEKVIINIKGKKQLIKCLLLKNNINIIASGELILEEGIKWYKLYEVKNNISKESLITSCTSNGNIKNNNSIINMNNDCTSPNWSVSNLSIKYNKSSSVKNNPISKEIVKIKLMVMYSNKKILNKNISNTNNNSKIIHNYRGEKNNDLTLRKTSYQKENNLLDYSLTEIENKNLKKNLNLQTTEKKTINTKKFIFAEYLKKQYSNKKMKIFQNKSCLGPIKSDLEEINSNSKRESTHTINYTKQHTTKKKIKENNNKKLYNENVKNRTLFNFYKRKNFSDNKYLFDNKINKNYKKNIDLNNKTSQKIHKEMNSCENFEDKILDQKFKNYLKNDENLKANLSGDNSDNSFNHINSDNLDESLNTKIDNINDANEEKIIDIKYKSIIPNEDVNIIKNLLEDTNNYEYEYYERAKIDFLLLYSAENIKNINKEDLFLEMQLMVEKLLKLQYFHQKEYMQYFTSINYNKKLLKYNKKAYIMLSKKMNKLNYKKFQNSLSTEDNRASINFINVRRKIMKNFEFPIWNTLMINSNKSSIEKKIKNNIINIFLNICSKNKNKLNKLSLKFYNEIKEKQNKQEKNKSIKQNKYNNKNNKNEINISTKINTNKKEYNFLFNKPITPAQYNTYLDANSKFKKGINTKKNITTKNIIENESISCYNKNYNIKKFNFKAKKPIIGNKFKNLKKNINKNQ